MHSIFRLDFIEMQGWPFTAGVHTTISTHLKFRAIVRHEVYGFKILDQGKTEMHKFKNLKSFLFYMCVQI